MLKILLLSIILFVGINSNRLLQQAGPGCCSKCMDVCQRCHQGGGWNCSCQKEPGCCHNNAGCNGGNEQKICRDNICIRCFPNDQIVCSPYGTPVCCDGVEYANECEQNKVCATGCVSGSCSP
eukprot:435470_1